MSWMHYNRETGEIDLLGYISELSCFYAVVMTENTWKVICKTNRSGNVKTRKRKFIEDLTSLLNSKDKTIMDQAYDYVLHIELSADESNAVISLQRKSTFEFIFRNEIISLKKVTTTKNMED